MLRKQRKLSEFAGSMLLSMLVFGIIYKFIPIVYATNDDRMIAEIISGQFTGTPESYAIQMSYGFTWFLSRLYLLTRSLNWYGIVLIGVQIFSFGTILYRLQSFAQKWVQKLLVAAAAVALFLAVWLSVYVQMTYTSTAAFAGLAAIFWYASSKTDWKNIVLAGILANLAFSIRPNVFYMLVPATGIVYLWKLIGKKERNKSTVLAPFLILSVTACLFAVNATAYSRPDWKEFMEFFDDRTQIYDYYDLAPYGEYPELYEPYGVSEEEYNMIRVYNYTVLGDLPKEFFPQYIQAYQKMEAAEGIGFGVKAVNAAETFAKDVLGNAYGMGNTLLFATAGILLIFLILKKKYPLAIYLAVQCTVNAALWLYFTYWGRTIDRIQVSMSLIFLAVILHTLVEIFREKDCKENESVQRAAVLVLLAVALVFAGKNFLSYRYENIEKANRYQDVQTIKEYCAADPSRLYYMDVATMTELYGRVTIGNTEPDYINYIQLGDWSAYCPHYEKKLQKHGVDSVADSITGENTYVIILHNYQLLCMKEYMSVTEQWEETIFGANDQLYAVYQFE